MPTASPLYGTTTAITITLNSLASDTTLLAGRQSTIIDNSDSGIDGIDILVGGKFVSHSSAPTTAKQIEVWAFATYDDGTTYNAVAGASDAALTVTAVKKALMRMVTIIPTDATTSSVYAWGPFSIMAVFGGFVPERFGFWVVQNTAQILNAAGNEMKYTTIKYEAS